MTVLPTVLPMLAAQGKAEMSTLVGSHIFDQKLDGLRCLAYWDGAHLRLVNRSGRDITAQFPDLIIASAPVPFVLDGEIIAGSGFQDAALRGKQNTVRDIEAAAAKVPANYVAFDCPYFGGTDLRKQPWHKRRMMLDTVVTPDLHERWQGSVWDPSTSLWDRVQELGLEGVIAKRIEAPYRAGRCSDWLKYKCVHRLTCVATGYEKGKGARADFGAMHLALLDGQDVVSVGRVGTGFTAKEIAELKTRLDAGIPFPVEIECLNVSRDGALRFPVYVGLRSDLSVLDATLDQLDTIPRM